MCILDVALQGLPSASAFLAMFKLSAMASSDHSCTRLRPCMFVL